MANVKFSTKMSVKTPRVRAASRVSSGRIPQLVKRDYSKKTKNPDGDFNLSFGQTGLTGRT